MNQHLACPFEDESPCLLEPRVSTVTEGDSDLNILTCAHLHGLSSSASHRGKPGGGSGQVATTARVQLLSSSTRGVVARMPTLGPASFAAARVAEPRTAAGRREGRGAPRSSGSRGGTHGSGSG